MEYIQFRFPKKNKDILEKSQFSRRFAQIYGKPVIVHAVHDEKTFLKILKDHSLKIPSRHNTPKKTAYMERLLGIEDNIYYSLGFTYAIDYGFRYNIIFDTRFVKELTYYHQSVNWQCYKAIVDYWFENDHLYLEKLACKNKMCKSVVNKYYRAPDGCKRKYFDFWKIEKELFGHIQNYDHKDTLIKIAKKTQKKYEIKYPRSLKAATMHYFTEKCPELLGKTDIDLLKSKYFLGFYIKAKISNKMKNALKKYSQRLMFYDGNDLKKIGDI